MLEFVLSCFPDGLVQKIRAVLKDIPGKIEEIRLRTGKKVCLCFFGKKILLDYFCAMEEIKNIIASLSNHSMYSKKETLAKGYFTANGGIRVGICGRYLYEDDLPVSVVDITSANIRMPCEVFINEGYINTVTENGRLLNILVFGKPGSGKTTFIRNICKKYSDLGKKTCVIDERNEIAAFYENRYHFELGQNTDVLTECKKNDGMMIAVMTLSPDLLIIDEIGGEKEEDSLFETVKCGVNVVASAHAGDIQELLSRDYLKKTMKSNIFDRYVLLGSSCGRGTVERIYDKERKVIFTNRENDKRETNNVCFDSRIKWCAGD